MKQNLLFRQGAPRIPGEPRLSPADLPSGCTVERVADVLTLSLHYWAGTEEPVVELCEGAARIGIGKFSRRLFRVTLKVPHNNDIHAVADDLAKAFHQLLENAPQPGSRLNYKMASNQLQLDTDAPPSWLIHAMQATAGSLRRSRP